jgi:hypothetical protein
MVLGPNQVLGIQFTKYNSDVTSFDYSLSINGVLTLGAVNLFEGNLQNMCLGDASFTADPNDYQFSNGIPGVDIDDIYLFYFDPSSADLIAVPDQNFITASFSVYSVALENFEGSIEVAIFDKIDTEVVKNRVVLYEEYSAPVIDDAVELDFNFSLGEVNFVELEEFDPVFELDTGNLNRVFTGSGVHLRRDVSFSFDFLDQQGGIIATDQDYLNNPLLDGAVFDIIDITGGLVVPNYLSGKNTRSLYLSELENEAIFGSYTKDFGVRVTLPNSFDDEKFTGVFFVYGNTPNIVALEPNFSEFSGEAKATEEFNIDIFLQNSLRFVKLDRYDIYASTGTEAFLDELTYLNPRSPSEYLFSQSLLNNEDIYNLRIQKNNLLQDTPYYFTVVPYGDLGSGAPRQFGPATFVSKSQNEEFNPISVSALDIVFGNSLSRTFYQTGAVSNSGILHCIGTGGFSTATYLVEIKDPSGFRRSSELKTVLNGEDALLLENPINNTGESSINYYVSATSGSGWCLYAENISGSSTYKLHGTAF